MTITYFPFDSGAGANVMESQWTKMARVWAPTGIVPGRLQELIVYGDGSGMNVKVAPGQVWIEGHLMQSDAIETLSVAAAHTTYNRLDLVVAYVRWDTKEMGLKVITGTAAASPIIPTITRTATEWQVILGSIWVAAGVTKIDAVDVSLFVENYLDSEWRAENNPLVYVSGTSFKIENVNMCHRYVLGTKVRVINGVSPYVRIFYVSENAAMDGDDTLVTVLPYFSTGTLTDATPIQAPMYSVVPVPLWGTHVPTIVGWATTPAFSSRFAMQGAVVTWNFEITTPSASNSTSVTVTAPFPTHKNAYAALGMTYDNGAHVANGVAVMPEGLNVCTCYKSARVAWTNSGNKAVAFTMIYRAYSP